MLVRALMLLAGVAAARNSSCAYYTTEGPTAASYTQHGFWDFRSLDADYQLTSSKFANDWNIATWTSDAGTSAPVKVLRTNENVFMQREKSQDYNSYLSLRASRSKDAYSTAEIDSTQQDIMYASFRARARVRGSAGACAGIFTFADNENESDIEILTTDSLTQIHYTNQPGVDGSGNSVPESSSQMSLPGGKSWNEWNDYRLDWTPEVSAWYVNGELATTKTYGIPKKPSSLILNMWGNGGAWTGDMADGNSAYLEVQWIQVAYNTTGSNSRVRRFASSGRTCNLDRKQ